MTRNCDYDAIIIGAGISGLVCGCYLARAGMKTLIVEKNAHPGGYCTSFKRGGYVFDACVHSLGSLREGGNMQTILSELQLGTRLNIKRHDPSDIICTPDVTVHFWNDFDQMIEEFAQCFPAEADGIRDLFDFIIQCEGQAFVSLRTDTFEDVLSRYIKDGRLKSILSIPLLGNAGLPASRISAITGVTIYKEFMLDGGYYPDATIQSLADIFLKRFSEFGGEALFSTLADTIEIEGKRVSGIIAGGGREISANYVISNADASQTMLKLVGREAAGDTATLIESLEPSLSMFVLYLGMKSDFVPPEGMTQYANFWYLPDYDVSRIFRQTVKGEIEELDWFIFRYLPEQNTAQMFVIVPYRNRSYWKTNKRRLIGVFVSKLERMFPGISPSIAFQDAATPDTLLRWTMNSKGAAYGWAKTPSQFAVTGLTQNTLIDNLYLTGHWTTQFQGVAGVAYLGRNTSQKILFKEKMS